MDAVAFISDCLAQVHLRLLATCEDLSNEQLLWRPAPTANNIGFILWHLARGEDARITNTGKLSADIWATESWYEKFDQPITAPDPGDRMGLQAVGHPLAGGTGGSYRGGAPTDFQIHLWVDG